MPIATSDEFLCSIVIASLVILLYLIIRYFFIKSKGNYSEQFKGSNPMRDMCDTLCPCHCGDNKEMEKSPDIADAISDVEVKEVNEIEDSHSEKMIRIDNLKKVTLELSGFVKKYYDDLIEVRKQITSMADLSRTVTFQKPISGNKNVKDFIDVYFISLQKIVGRYISALLDIRKNTSEKNISDGEQKLTKLFLSLYGMEKFSEKGEKGKNFNNIIDIHNKMIRDVVAFEVSLSPGALINNGSSQLQGNGIKMYNYSQQLKKSMGQLYSSLDDIYNPDGGFFQKFEGYFGMIDKYHDMDSQASMLDKYKKSPFHITEYITTNVQ
jgi:hypothetical protein